MTPKVTVIHTCYNHAKFVIDSLDSVRNQTFRNFEWIIIDDCSKDDSANLIEKWISTNQIECQFIRHEKNIGFCATLNEAISIAKGELISYFSADDIMLPDKLKFQVDIFESAGEKVGVVYCNAHQIDDEGALLKDTFFDTYHRIYPPPEGNIFATLLKRNFIPAPSTMIRRSCYEQVGGYDERLTLEDWDMWIRIARNYEFAYCPYMGIYYRQHMNNTLKHIEKNSCGNYKNTFLSFEKIIKTFPLTRAEFYWPKRHVIKSAAEICRALDSKKREILWRGFRCTRSLIILVILGLDFILSSKTQVWLLTFLLKTKKKMNTLFYAK